MAAKPMKEIDKLRHSAAHVMADAVKRLFPGAKITIGPPIENGFYYDFDVEQPFSDADLERIEATMAEIIKADHPFEMQKLEREEAQKLFTNMGEPYKLELLDTIPADEPVTICRHGDFVDLCRGGHVDRTGQIKAFKLTGVAGAYWRGDERNKMLQRIYGTAFFDMKALRKHLNYIEEAKKRDHRRLGKDLDLFSINETIGPGLVLWHPKGAFIRHCIETFWKKAHLDHGYDLLYTPHIARDALWQQSGHSGFYAENMFSQMDVDGQNYLAKPMNCPFHVTVFRSNLRSYRDLPLRWAELGTVYRYERSGVLHGLFRVRGFTQDDAHLFVTPEQLQREIHRVIGFCLAMLRAFEFSEFELYLSTRPEKFVGLPEQWDEAERILREALEASGVAFDIDEGGGVFYGPKIDLKIKDSLGRRWQCSTIQVDFQLPERFSLTYVGEDGDRNRRPILIHRALFGSLERFFGILIEHYAGAFPLWLCPTQAVIISVNERNAEYAKGVGEKLKTGGMRIQLDTRNETLSARIRSAQLSKVPYMIIVGDKEQNAETIAPRPRSGKPMGAVSIDTFLSTMGAAITMPQLKLPNQ